MDIPNIQPPAAAQSSQLNLDIQNGAVQQQLSRLPVGVTLVGAVVGNDKNGNLIIRLAGNDLILSSPLALSKDAQVALKIENVSGNMIATLLSIDGKLPATQPQAISNQLQQNPNALLKDFVDNSANAKIVSILNQGAAKVAPQAAAPQTSPVIAKSDIVTLTSQQTSTVKGILITAAPEIAQSIRSSIALNKSETGNNDLAESIPEEVTPGSQLNLKITNVQNPPKNTQNPESRLVQTGNSVLAKPEETAKPATISAAATAPEAPAAPEQISAEAALKLPAAGLKQIITPSPEEQPSAAPPGQIITPANIKQTANPQLPIDTSTAPANLSANSEPSITQPPIPNQTKNQQSEIGNDLKTLVQNFAASFKPLPNGNIMLNAIVIDTKPGGELLVETRFGKVIINAGEQFASVEKGSVLNLELSGIAAAAKDDIKLPGDELPLQQLSKTWPVLKELADHLAPDLGAATMPNKLAGLEDNNFAGRLAAFLNAVKTGNIRDWLGANNYDALEDDASGSGILSKLKHDMDSMRDLMNQRSNSGWQTMLFPVYDGRDLHQARLHVKYLPDHNQQPDRSAGTRFIVELNTSYFGEIQMDGLVHNNVSSKYFDMIVRTHKPLEDQMELDIRQIFTDAGQITGFKGDIEFATMKEFPLRIMEEIINRKLTQQIDHKGIEA